MNFSIASEAYKPGYRKLHSEAGFDYALNRWLPHMDESEIRQAATAIHSIDDWIREFTRLAEVADKTERWLNASFYYCAAEFYQSRESPGRAQLMKRSLQMFDNFIVEWGAERHSVPFKHGLLPALVL